MTNETTYYLLDNPPKQRQYHTSRSKQVTRIVIHTAENVPDRDLTNGDKSAENVASFIQRRTDHGSYHAIVDSDTVLWLIPPHYTAFGAKNWNSNSLHLSFACRTTDWNTLPRERVEATLRKGAFAAAQMLRWVERHYGADNTIPIEWVTHRNTTKGFSPHSALDPSRRNDPGDNFPHEAFLGMIRVEMGGQSEPADTGSLPTQKSTEVGPRTVRTLQTRLNLLGHNLAVDNNFGPLTLAATLDVIGRHSSAQATIASLREQLVAAEEIRSSDTSGLSIELEAAKTDIDELQLKIDELNTALDPLRSDAEDWQALRALAHKLSH